MGRWVTFLLLAVLLYLAGTYQRTKRCRQQWDAAHPYSFTGKEITHDPNIPFPLRTTPAAREAKPSTGPIVHFGETPNVENARRKVDFPETESYPVAKPRKLTVKKTLSDPVTATGAAPVVTPWISERRPGYSILGYELFGPSSQRLAADKIIRVDGEEGEESSKEASSKPSFDWSWRAPW